MNRICIYPKDIQLITGKSYRQSTRLMQKIKKELNKPENEFLTIDEFCTYTGIKYEQVTHLILVKIKIFYNQILVENLCKSLLNQFIF